jgi:hypothetical protein
MLGSMGSAADQPSSASPREALTDAWWTGSLLAPNASCDRLQRVSSFHYLASHPFVCRLQEYIGQSLYVDMLQ